MENNKINMEQPNEEQVNVTEVKENEEEVTPISSDGSIGKFKDAESLLFAYNNLQAEFTRKCQKLSEFENAKLTQTEEDLLSNDKNLAEFVSSNQNLKDTLLKAYLEELQKNQSPKVISSSAGSGILLKTPPKPTSLEEAKEIVNTMFL